MGEMAAIEVNKELPMILEVTLKHRCDNIFSRMYYVLDSIYKSLYRSVRRSHFAFFTFDSIHSDL